MRLRLHFLSLIPQKWLYISRCLVPNIVPDSTAVSIPELEPEVSLALQTSLGMDNISLPPVPPSRSTNLPDQSRRYKYQPLRDREIRLLKLDATNKYYPNDGKATPLTGEIIVARLPSGDHDESTMSLQSMTEDASGSTTVIQRKSSTKSNASLDLPCYDALSYVWGGDNPQASEGRENRLLYIMYPPDQHEHLGPWSYLEISPNLDAALRSFRSEVDSDRSLELYLWIDAVCINQNDLQERSTQIQRMADIYSCAYLVRVWLGAEDEDSKVAFKVIDKILSMEDFEEVISDSLNAEQWAAFRNLIQKSWFKRRWIVQEVAFARDARVYCGQQRIAWNHLAAAISLFADARYELRRMFHGAKAVQNNPDYLGEVNSYSAKTLVDYISLMFRRSGDDTIMEHLLSLESLLTALTPFESNQPHDSVYAIMHLSHDAQPVSTNSIIASNTQFGEDQPTYNSFNDFNSNIPRTSSPDSMLPNAPQVAGDLPLINEPEQPDEQRGRSLLPGNVRAQPRQGISRSPSPLPGARRRAEQRAESPIKKIKRKFKVEYNQSMFRLSVEVMNHIVLQSRSIDIICKPWVPEVLYDCKTPHKTKQEDRYMLPSWIQSLRKRTYGLDPMSQNKRYSRVAADSLVGSDSFGGKSYSACANLPVPRAYRPPGMISNRHFKAQGFVLDVVSEVSDRALDGIIPKEWLTLGNWTTTEQDPPEQFWRTLVANRESAQGPRQPPHHWPHACKWVFKRRAVQGNLDTTAMINHVHGVPSIRTLGFLERMRAVVWNRKLIKTQGFVDESTKGEAWISVLGLAPPEVLKGDLICILYGCSVPVILRPYNPSKRKSSSDTSNLENANQPRKRRRRTSGAHQSINSSVSTFGHKSPAAPPARTNHRTAFPSKLPRTSSPIYTLIGECYVHSYMDGEAFGRNEDSKRDIEFLLGCVENCNCPYCQIA